MAKNITVMGASYTDVPSIRLPQTGGGWAEFWDYDEVLEMLYPVGTIYMSTSSTAPDFGGTWREVLLPATWGDIEDGTRSYTYGTSTGTVHYWKRIA